MIPTYWWPDIPNAGDLLTGPLLNYFANLSVKWAPVRDARLVCTGSVLEHIPPGWAGHVLGSGRLLEDSPLNLGGATVHAVRGPLSARGIKGDFALGDPGLLADEMADIPTRDVELGVVPHWSDTDLAHRWLFEQYSPVVISAWQDPLKFVSAIGRCKKIVSSSLHGIILADAFGIPRRTEACPRFSQDPREGAFFKFKDYNASVGIPFRIGETQAPKRGAVEDRKHEIWDAFRAIGTQL